MFDWLNYHTLSVLGLAAAFGGMLFFSGVMAPLIFTQLPMETAGVFIRRVFPWYYAVIGGFSLFALLFNAIRMGPAAWETLALLFVVLGFVYARQWLMPSINRARDQASEGDGAADTRFSRLHRFSVLINSIQLLIITVLLVHLVS